MPPDEVKREVERTLEYPPDKQAGDEPGKGVRVAVLDTWPRDTRGPLALIDDVYEQLRNRPIDPVDEPFLRDAANGTLVAPDNVHDLVGGPPLAGVRCVRRRDGSTVDPPYPLPDHGLFIANLVRDIARNAEIHVYRVCNDWGNADLETVTTAVQDAIDQFNQDRDAKKVNALVINLSLGFGPEMLLVARQLLDDPTWPLLDRDSWVRHVAATVPGVGPVGTRAAVVRNMEKDVIRVERSLWGLDHVFGFDLAQEQVFVVAAAGNDSSRRRRKVAGPRVPAAIEGVLGVSAIKNRRGDPADYSNEDDFINTEDDGVGAWGGDVDDSTGRTTDGVIGLYVSRKIPPDGPDMPRWPGTGSTGGDANTRGWARWAGTSFAAPIASAFAACLWSEQPGYTAREIMNRIIWEPGTNRRQPRQFIPLFQGSAAT